MAKVLGIGGVFFKCRDKAALAAWYRDHLGFELSEYGGTDFGPAALPPGARTVWSPFDGDTDYFDPSTKPFMVNLIVDDLDGALERVRAGGARLVGEPQSYDYGRFGWFLDPEGHKIELWQPAAPDTDD